MAQIKGSSKAVYKDFKNVAVYADSIIKLLYENNKLNKQNATLEFAKIYEIKKMIQENIFLKQEARIQELKAIQEHNTFYIISAAIIVISTILMLLIYFRYRCKKKVSEILLKRNSVIQLKNEYLEKANATKQKFFSIISHDLINPFNAILGYTDLLDKKFDTFKDTEKKEFISTIKKYATHNYNLTKNLLEWSRVQQNSIILKEEQLNIESIIVETLDTYESLAKRKKIVTNVYFEDAYYVYADKNCLKTILNNIYSNAIKYSYNLGVIDIIVKNNSEITTIQIKDYGVGMKKEQVKNLFKMSDITTTLGTDNEKGTGLGFLICKELIDLHDGKIKIDVISEPNKGTTITLSL
ncbi:HAMP domain-containing histidine kinase [Polaribacter batillariae]|uniref:histidine kinase n=1 Tax=Polaribacter batillariae TaxID=2808900 RepID=A0ABX7SUW9_9FLAO|nr:HAMP domain-containing sensor histidine kinase [Polaribacter batillariae]QTD36766.1 HAMP domain-containing histidine kinase [Polaribacter batillariae]